MRRRPKILGIAAPASPFDKKSFLRGVNLLRKWGFTVRYRPNIFERKKYLAGSDTRRARELQQMLSDADLDGILFARGGYGSQRILPRLHLSKFKRRKKILVGFSDLTPLLIYLHGRLGLPTFYGPSVGFLGTGLSSRGKKSLHETLKNPMKAVSFPLTGCKILRSGRTEGKVVGGCLSLLTSSLGTSYELKTKRSILFIEDVGEKLYAIDRMLTHLKNTGKLNGIRGILVGSLKPKDASVAQMETLLLEVFSNFKGPIVTRFPSGHTKDFLTLPLGRKAILDTKRHLLHYE